MNITKKTLMIMLCFESMISFMIESRADDEKKKTYIVEKDSSATRIWASIAGAAVAGTAICYLLSELDTCRSTSSTECCVTDLPEYQIQSPKARQIKQQLDSLKKYGQIFDLYNNEQAVITTLHKLGISLQQIDFDFYDKLNHDYTLLSNAGYSIWWHGFKELEYQKNLYLNNSCKIITFFNRHHDFIQACQIMNSYNQLSAYPYDILHWVYSKQAYRNKQYPLITYKDKVELDRQNLGRLQYNRLYPVLAEKVSIVCNFLDYILEIIYQSHQYQQQVIQKKQDELAAEAYRIEQEKLELARKQIKAQEEANRIAAERNRIEMDKFFKD